MKEIKNIIYAMLLSIALSACVSPIKQLADEVNDKCPIQMSCGEIGACFYENGYPKLCVGIDEYSVPNMHDYATQQQIKQEILYHLSQDVDAHTMLNYLSNDNLPIAVHMYRPSLNGDVADMMITTSEINTVFNNK